MFASLIFRNVLRNLPRLLPMLVVLVIAFLLLFVGNGILASSQDSLYRVYTANVSGDLSVSARGESNFTIFGSDALLVGEYLVPPTLVRFEELRDVVERLPEVRATGEIVTSAARVEIGRRRANQTLFGVDFDRYPRLFPDLEIIAGHFPAPGERGVLVQAGWSGTGDDTHRLIGQPAILAVAHNVSFTIREVPVTGIFRYPVEDDLLDRVALVDPDTARALNGYIYGAATLTDIPEQDRDLFDSDFDDMFAHDDWEEELQDEIDPLAELDAYFAESREEAVAARRTVEGAWNFLLISLHNREDAGFVTRELERHGLGGETDFLIRPWRNTVGGNAQLAWYLQLIFNAGMLFVAFGAAIITTNALVLSVLERTYEIGTMRALGATRSRVAAMITTETLLLVAGAALLGVLLGVLSLAVLNRAGWSLDNPYIAILFGGGGIRGTATVNLVITHLTAGLALALVAVLYPLKRALGISPVKAMAV